MNLIAVSGQTSTGKSTIALRLSSDLNIAAYLKDAHKEAFFNSLRKQPNVKQMYEAERNAWEVLYVAVRNAMVTDTDLIIEGNFTSTQKRELQKIVDKNVNIIEIFCYAKGFAPYKRHVARHRSGERHPGHRDWLWHWIVWLEAICGMLGWHWIKPLQLGKSVMKLDATYFSKVDYATIRSYVTNHLK